MSFVLIALILGLALSIEEYLFELSHNKYGEVIEDIESAMSNGGVDQLKKFVKHSWTSCKYILTRVRTGSEGIEMVEKSVYYGGVQMGLLEEVYLGLDCLLHLHLCLGLWER